MDSWDELVERVRAWAVADASDRGERLPDPATAEQIDQFETRVGYRLHPLLRRLYLDVANGGFGPDRWRLHPIEKVGGYRRMQVPSGQPLPWPDRVVTVMDVGCGMESAVDCSDTSGRVLLFDPSSFGSDEPEAWSLDSPTLAGWLEGWLDKTCWLADDDLDPDDEGGWPVPWADAAARLMS